MGKTGHGKIGHKKKVYRYNYVDNTFYQVKNINSDLIQHAPKNIAKRKFRKTTKHVDPVVNSLKPFTMADKKALLNPHNDTKILVYFFKTTSSISSCAK